MVEEVSCPGAREGRFANVGSKTPRFDRQPRVALTSDQDPERSRGARKRTVLFAPAQKCSQVFGLLPTQR